MAMMPAVSVIMPAYNAQCTIDEAIRSVLNQQEISFELLIGDDASTDHSWDRIHSYWCDPRVRIYRFRENRGPAAARNRLASMAKGRYLSICDSDDELLPGNLKRLTEILDRDPSIGIACPSWAYMDEAGTCISPSAWPYRLRAPEEWWDLLGGIGSHGGSLIRHSVFKKVGGYREELSGAEDPDLFLRCAEVSRIIMGPDACLYRYRHRSRMAPRQFLARKRRIESMLREAIHRRYGYRVPW